jgi:GTPase
MAESNFVDLIRIYCRSGNGGAGSVHFYRDKKTAKGGPDGGDGGRGGHVILRGNLNIWTLLPLRYRKHIYAEHGINGSAKNCTGAIGEDAIVEVPLGTIVRNPETGEVLCEINRHGEEQILFSGGRGGLGNINFKSPTMQTPRFAQPGEPGIEMWVEFELKILADVGLVGFPNAGKSTLLGTISAAKPKVADYAFTTLTPNLGIVYYKDDRSFVMADIPGIIEGASEGKGLGLRFLRHIERNSMLLFLIPADTKDIVDEYKILLNELNQYNPELLDKRRILGISKCDRIDDEIKADLEKNLPDIPYVFFSSFTQQGLFPLKDLIWKELNSNTEW